MLLGKLRVLCRNRWLVLTAGFLLGVLVVLLIRFVTYNPPHTHYHANFAVYINGAREEFKGPQYYQEVSICSASGGVTIPQQRAHMHDNANSVVHVHDHAVTWGQFFENLGWTVGPNFIANDKGALYTAGGAAKLHVLIDGQDYTDLTPINNTVIKDQSRLLVSYGDIDAAALKQEYQSVPSTAKHYDESKDPASCSSNESLPFKERLHHLF
jgi:hypothetical protein